MNIGTTIYTWLNGREVGQDTFGNRYYEHKSDPAPGYRRKRWVVYNGLVEASKVPPEWHGWLHYTAEAPLSAEKAFEWEQDHLPNLTGTRYAYRPPGHVLEGGKREAATGDYEAWTPN